MANERTRRNRYKPKYSKIYSNTNFFCTKGRHSLKEVAESPFLEILKLDCSCRWPWLEHGSRTRQAPAVPQAFWDSSWEEDLFRSPQAKLETSTAGKIFRSSPRQRMLQLSRTLETRAWLKKISVNHTIQLPHKVQSCRGKLPSSLLPDQRREKDQCSSQHSKPHKPRCH